MNPNTLFISNIEVIADQLKPIYCVGYVVEPSDTVLYKNLQLKDLISYVYDNYRIDGVKVVKSQTVSGQIIDSQHIIDFIEHNYRRIIRNIIKAELIKKDQDNVN